MHLGTGGTSSQGNVILPTLISPMILLRSSLTSLSALTNCTLTLPVARELTKIYETFYRGNLEEFKKIKENLKGEITIIIGSPENKENLEEYEIDEDQIKKIILLTKKKFSTKDLSILLSIIYKKPKKFFYTKVIKMSDNKKN